MVIEYTVKKKTLQQIVISLSRLKHRLGFFFRLSIIASVAFTQHNIVTSSADVLGFLLYFCDFSSLPSLCQLSLYSMQHSVHKLLVELPSTSVVHYKEMCYIQQTRGFVSETHSSPLAVHVGLRNRFCVFGYESFKTLICNHLLNCSKQIT